MPIATELLSSVLKNGSQEIALASAMGAFQASPNSSKLEAAYNSGSQVVGAIGSDLPKYVCGAARLALVKTPIVGSVLRFGEAAVGKLLCDSEVLPDAKRKRLALDAVADLLVPGASSALDIIEMATSKDAHLAMKTIAPGLTRTEGYKAVASALGMDGDTDKAPAVQAKTPSPAEPAAVELDAALGDRAVSLPAPVFASAEAIAAKLDARRQSTAKSGLDDAGPTTEPGAYTPREEPAVDLPAPAFADEDAIVAKLANRRGSIANQDDAGPAIKIPSRPAFVR